MDLVSKSLLNEFSSERDLTHLPEDKRFEHFSCFITVGRHYSESFDTEDILVGSATGIDAIAVIVNGELITDAESVQGTEAIGELDVTFVFVQADRSAGWDSGKIGNFGFAVADFFKEKPTIARNDKISSAASIKSELYKRSSKFKRGCSAPH